MEKFKDLKFEGDLSFLNENLEEAFNAFKNKKNENENEESNLKLEILMLKKKLENFENLQSNQFIQSHITSERSLQNAKIIQNTRNDDYASGNHKHSETQTNHQDYKDIRIEKNTNFKSYQEKEVEVEQPSNGKRKSQLEPLLLSSGYNVEAFNNLKIELLDLEKDKIILKYKQDLMMLILKS